MSAVGTAPAEMPRDWHAPDIVALGDSWVRVVYHEDADLPRPRPPFDDTFRRNGSVVVVMIAALREKRCPDTLASIFGQASHPARVRIALVQQNAPGDPDCLAAACAAAGTPLTSAGAAGEYANPHGCAMFERVRVRRMAARDARGPLYARAQQPALLREGDDFCMQIDAHTVFSRGWDVEMLREWGSARNEFAVLTTYPTNVKDMNRSMNDHREMPHLCAASWIKAGVLRNGQARAAANLSRPLMSPLWAAGLSFSRCHAERRVPADPSLPDIFNGEEYSRGARLWTHGYDFYSVTRPLIGVYYGNEKGTQGGWQVNRTCERASQQRMATLLEAPGSDQSEAARARLGAFGLGTRRSLDQYVAFSGVDPRAMKADVRCVVEWVAWSEPEGRADGGAAAAAASAEAAGRDGGHGRAVLGADGHGQRALRGPIDAAKRAEGSAGGPQRPPRRQQAHAALVTERAAEIATSPLEPSGDGSIAGAAVLRLAPCLALLALLLLWQRRRAAAGGRSRGLRYNRLPRGDADGTEAVHSAGSPHQRWRQPPGDVQLYKV